MRRRARLGLVSVAALRGVAAVAAERAAPLHIVFGAAGIPHPEKAAKGGEDAFFADDQSNAFGVADGVGGSATDEVDPGEFSREILRRCRDALRTPPPPGDATPISRALKAASAEPLHLGGSSTLLLGHLEPLTHTLRVANLGDSGAMVFRPSFRRFRAGNVLWPRLLLRSQDQTHSFNTPYQAAADDFSYTASRVDEISTVVCEGDILVAATDGVLDNLFDLHVQNTVARALRGLRAKEAEAVQTAVDELAQSIANEAHNVGLREDEEGLHTPFEVAAAQEGMRFCGGKLDDVAVVCGVVRAGAPPPQRVLSNFEYPLA